MSMFKSTTTITFRERVEGTWGEFATPTGRVGFILTKARLGARGVDSERRLTAQLHPVREILPIEQLDFNQLLQRDLDDHRVVEGLIPYLLKTRRVGPAFFPPIMAVLLPFDSTKPTSFPEKSFEGKVQDEEMSGANFHELRYGAAYRTQQLINDDGSPHRIRLGRLDWNNEHAKLVVLDGQHRAMALLAIDRTVNGTWDQAGAGGKYRHFYDAKVRELLKEAGGEVDLNKIEIPVTICWFPGLGAASDPHKAARKLFVDVNKEARTPSESRITLLSDTELLNIFTRSLLNRLRQSESDPPLPIYAIEYDNPKKEAWKPAKWTVLTTLFLLKNAIQRCVFGPRDSIADVTASLSMVGRPPWQKMDKYMREQLAVNSLFRDTIPDGDRVIQRTDIGNEIFPAQQVDLLVDQFMKFWGDPILTILGGLRPYHAHWKALQQTRDNWLTDDAKSKLARDALFEGVGLYWTLQESYNHWLSLREVSPTRPDAPEPTKTEIVRVWDIVQDREAEFHRLRAKEYLDRKKEFAPTDTKKSSIELEKVAEVYDVANTNACQLGAILAFASLAHEAKKAGLELAPLATSLVRGWNAALLSKRTANESRLFILASGNKTIKHPINRIAKLDTPFAVHFRYFWLELLRLRAARDLTSTQVDDTVLDSLTEKARGHYAAYLVNEQFKHERAVNEDPKATSAKLMEKAVKRVEKELADSFEHWFEMSNALAKATAAAAVAKTSTSSKDKVEIPEHSAVDATAGDAAESATEDGASDDIESIMAEGPDD